MSIVFSELESECVARPGHQIRNSNSCDINERGHDLSFLYAVMMSLNEIISSAMFKLEYMFYE